MSCTPAANGQLTDGTTRHSTIGASTERFTLTARDSCPTACGTPTAERPENAAQQSKRNCIGSGMGDASNGGQRNGTRSGKSSKDKLVVGKTKPLPIIARHYLSGSICMSIHNRAMVATDGPV